MSQVDKEVEIKEVKDLLDKSENKLNELRAIQTQLDNSLKFLYINSFD